MMSYCAALSVTVCYGGDERRDHLRNVFSYSNDTEWPTASPSEARSSAVLDLEVYIRPITGPHLPVMVGSAKRYVHSVNDAAHAP